MRVLFFLLCEVYMLQLYVLDKWWINYKIIEDDVDKIMLKDYEI